VQVVVERATFAQELRAEHDPQPGEAFAGAAGEAHGDGRLDDGDGPRVDALDGGQDVLDRAGVEEVAFLVVVRGGGDDDVVGVAVRRLGVGRRRQPQLARREIVLDLAVDDRRPPRVDQVHAVGVDVDGDDVVVLGQDDGVGQAHVAEPGDGDLHAPSLGVSPS